MLSVGADDLFKTFVKSDEPLCMLCMTTLCMYVYARTKMRTSAKLPNKKKKTEKEASDKVRHLACNLISGEALLCCTRCVMEWSWRLWLLGVTKERDGFS